MVRQNNSQKLGKEGEEVARQYLLNAGYTILHCNWRHKRLEVDIIAQKEKLIVFVEVKARRSNAFGEPELFVDEAKQDRLIEAAHHFLQDDSLELEARFDIVAVTGPGYSPEVKHLAGAFYPGIK